MSGYTIIRDNKEKVGYWDFSHVESCDGQVVKHLKTADYTLEGFEDILAIERKRTTAEISTNVGTKWETFKKEFERLRPFKYKYVLCEFSLDDILSFPAKSGIPKFKLKYIKMNGKFILKRINELQDEYEVEFIFCGSKSEAEKKAIEIFNNVYFQN